MITPITVLMPVYNGECYLERAIQSILFQSFEDFKFLIIDDGSTDSSPSILDRYQSEDPRIEVIRNPKNIGLIKTLNKGLDAIDTKYVARMDCDDYALPGRLEAQVNFMEASPSVGACGTWITVKDASDGSEYIQRYPTQHDKIKLDMLTYCAIAHPSVILRKSLLDIHNLRYDPDFMHAEDYELWTRAIHKIEFANIPEPLLEYNIHPQNVSSQNEKIQHEAAAKIRLKQLSRLIMPQPKEGSIITHLFTNQLHPPATKQDFIVIRDLLERLFTANKKKQIYSETLFDDFIFKTWYRICKKSKIPTISPSQEFIRSKISMQRGSFRFLILSLELSIKGLKRSLNPSNRAGQN
jgi:glycosyltransferase involved in cell wall biosynthesis